MIKFFVTIFALLSSLPVWAEKPIGFLWYNVVPEKMLQKKAKPKGIPFQQLSFTERDAVLHFYTMEALHKARQTKKVEDMRVFLSIQDYWLKESSRFRDLFQKTMLAYPEYDYTVTHPTSNLGTKITDEVREQKQKRAISSLSKSHGLLFFYRGKSPYDIKQIPILADFCQQFHLTLMPVSVDGVKFPLIESNIDQGQAERLNVRYFPAILLVNPKTHETTPIAYGLTTQDILASRLQNVTTSLRAGEA
jgi:conjugal transfer pilus assembly protein TraF